MVVVVLAILEFFGGVFTVFGVEPHLEEERMKLKMGSAASPLLLTYFILIFNSRHTLAPAINTFPFKINTNFRAVNMLISKF